MTIPGQHIYCNVKHIQELDSVFYIEIINNFDYFYCIGSSKKKSKRGSFVYTYHIHNSKQICFQIALVVEIGHRFVGD